MNFIRNLAYFPHHPNFLLLNLEYNEQFKPKLTTRELPLRIVIFYEKDKETLSL